MLNRVGLLAAIQLIAKSTQGQTSSLDQRLESHVMHKNLFALLNLNILARDSSLLPLAVPIKVCQYRHSSRSFAGQDSCC